MYFDDLILPGLEEKTLNKFVTPDHLNIASYVYITEKVVWYTGAIASYISIMLYMYSYSVW